MQFLLSKHRPTRYRINRYTSANDYAVGFKLDDLHQIAAGSLIVVRFPNNVEVVLMCKENEESEMNELKNYSDDEWTKL